MMPSKESITRAVVFTVLVYAIVWRVPQIKQLVTGGNVQ